jgi:hypothetical protein
LIFAAAHRLPVAAFCFSPWLRAYNSFALKTKAAGKRKDWRCLLRAARARQ